MPKVFGLPIGLALFLLAAPLKGQEADTLALSSPDGRLHLAFHLDDRGRPTFQIEFADQPLVSGTLGIEFHESGPLSENLQVVGAQRRSADQTYAIPVGKTSSARDQHHELVVSLVEPASPGRRLEIAFRAFNDGIAFRYQLPRQDALADFVITDELTRFAFADDPIAKVLPLSGYTTPYEAYYQRLRISEMENGQLAGLPLLLQHPGGAWIAVTEADLTDYAGMYLARIDGEPQALQSKLSPLPTAPVGLKPSEAKVIGRTPFASPWRVLMIADDPGRLIECNMIFNLNPPCAIDDPSWIKPGKTTFPWWNHYVVEGVDFEPGVNTATMLHYIDFCAESGIPYHSLDGLDIAWYGGPIAPDGPTDVTRAAPSIDLPRVLQHARDKDVRLRLWMHWRALQPQLEEAFATYERWGIEGVMIDFMDRDDQEMVRWYHRVAELAAEHHLTVTWHGAYKPTGMERTWPNVLTSEAVLNQEYNKWQPPGVIGTPPRHNLDVAFVRMLAGPLDYHQGGMRNVLPENYEFRDIAPPVQGTRGHQLAMYVVYLNHLSMIADYPQAYRGEPGFEFIVDVPTTWDETRVPVADPETCIVIARRSGDAWHLGGMTADEESNVRLPLDFLGDGSYEATLYEDDSSGGPTSIRESTLSVSRQKALTVSIPRSGGFAARLTPAESRDDRNR